MFLATFWGTYSKFFAKAFDDTHKLWIKSKVRNFFAPTHLWQSRQLLILVIDQVFKTRDLFLHLLELPGNVK